MGPDVVQHPLARADGSAVFSDGLYTVIAGVNGPVDVSRRDELPEEAFIDVHIRPSSGVGGPKERWLESVVHSVLKSVLLVSFHPRTLVQVTLQITKQPSQKLTRMTADVSVIPTLVNAAFLALLDSGLPLSSTTSAVLAVRTANGEVILRPQEKDLAKCNSIHAMAYNQVGAQLLDQSAGSFNITTWEKVAQIAQQVCTASFAKNQEDDAMAIGDADTRPWLRQALQDQAEAATAWRDAV